eukprot:jgi/Ulvmu1/1402/UM011_0130.1
MLFKLAKFFSMGAKSSKQEPPQACERSVDGTARPGSNSRTAKHPSVGGAANKESSVPVPPAMPPQGSPGCGNVDKITSQILTGSTAQAEALFYQYDKDRDGFLSPAEVNDGLSKWGLNLQPDMFSQFVEVNFLYSDRDQDGLLSLVEWVQLFKLMSEVGKKFSKEDMEGNGLINKAAFARIVAGLDLKLSPAMQKNYIDVNWRFVDRALQGRISFGQFLSCYANFLYSYEISQGMRRRHQNT